MSIAVTTRGTNFYDKYATAYRIKEEQTSDESEFLKHVERADAHSISKDDSKTCRNSIFDQIESGRTAPYASLADENGIIEYEGAVFTVDYESNSICLGDCSPGADYLTISLPDSGGCLKVNRDNIGQLMKAISMFSPKDRWAIIRAVSTDNYCERVKAEMEKEEDSEFSDVVTSQYSITKDPKSEGFHGQGTADLQKAVEEYEKNLR